MEQVVPQQGDHQKPVMGIFNPQNALRGGGGAGTGGRAQGGGVEGTSLNHIANQWQDMLEGQGNLFFNLRNPGLAECSSGFARPRGQGQGYRGGAKG